MGDGVAYGRRVLLRLVAICFIVMMLGGAVGAVLKGKDVVSAFGDRIENGAEPGDEPEVTAAKRKLCRTLDGATRRALIGRPTPVKLLNVEGELDPYTCRWAPKDYQQVAAFVEVVAAPADKWALSLRPNLFSQPLEPALKKRLLAIIDAPKVTRADGCRFARTIFAARGAPQGAERTVTQSAPGERPSITAHSCVNGTYYAVLVTAPDLRLDDALGAKLADDLRLVEQKLG